MGIGKMLGLAALGAAIGYVMSRKEEEGEERNWKANKKAQRATKIAEAHKEHTNYILALLALGILMANTDGKISEEELKVLHEFVGGLSSKKYPEHIRKQIDEDRSNPLL